MNQLQAFGVFFPELFAAGRSHAVFNFDLEIGEINVGKKLMNRLGSHGCGEVFTILFLRIAEFQFGQKLAALEWGIARVDNNEIFVVDDALELAGRHIQHETQAGRHALVEPDVGDWNRKINVAHPLATNAGNGDLNATTIANDALMLDAFIFAARAFPVPCWAENTFTEQTAFFGLECTIVDRFRIFYFALAPAAHGVW